MTSANLAMMPLAEMHHARAPGDRHYGKLCDPANSKGRIGTRGGNVTTPVIAAAWRGERKEVCGRARQAGRLLLALIGAFGRQGEANG
jgi:hypothetical protein